MNKLLLIPFLLLFLTSCKNSSNTLYISSDEYNWTTGITTSKTEPYDEAYIKMELATVDELYQDDDWYKEEEENPPETGDMYFYYDDDRSRIENQELSGSTFHYSVTDKKGEGLYFKSELDALNYMARVGYEVYKEEAVSGDIEYTFKRKD